MIAKIAEIPLTNWCVIQLSHPSWHVRIAIARILKRNSHYFLVAPWDNKNLRFPVVVRVVRQGASEAFLDNPGREPEFKH